MTQLPHETMVGIRYKDGRILQSVPYNVEWDGTRFMFEGFFKHLPAGLVIEAGIRLMGQWQWSPMAPQTFNARRKWSWRKFRRVELPTQHTMTVTYTWRQSWI